MLLPLKILAAHETSGKKWRNTNLSPNHIILLLSVKINYKSVKVLFLLVKKMNSFFFNFQ